MTRVEITGVRELNFSGWIRNNLPDSSTGFLVTDLDFILYNYRTKRIALCEVKTRNVNVKFAQQGILGFIDSCIKKGKPLEWEYLGLYIIKFDTTFFHDGHVYLNGILSNEEEIKEVLSMKL